MGIEQSRDEMLRIAQLKFIGDILSLYDHDLNNHLAVMKESIGLMEDILNMKKTSKDMAGEHHKIIQSIENQISKVNWLSRQLSSFGRRMDSPCSEFSVNQIIEELLILLSRTARQNMIRFEKEFMDNIPLLNTDPLKLQFLIFCLLEKAVKTSERDASVVIKTGFVNSLVEVSIISKGNVMETATNPGGAGEKELCRDEIYKHILGQEGWNISREGVKTTIMLPVPAASDSQDKKSVKGGVK